MTKPLPPKYLVLYADDDPDDIDLVKEAFQQYSNHVDFRTFRDGELLIRFLESLSADEPLPCLVILDINMPRLTGKEALKILREQKRFDDMAIVLFSTSTLPSEKAFARSFNAGFVSKPLHSGQIEQLIHLMLESCPEDVKRVFKK